MECKTLKQNIERYCSKVDTDRWTEFVRDYSAIGDSLIYGGKHGGSDAEHAGAEYIAQQLRSIGVEKVEIVETPVSKYQFNDARLRVISDIDNIEHMEIRPYGYRSPGTGSNGITASLVDVGTATRDELKNLNIEGKIALFCGMDVLEAGNLIAQIEETVINKAAALLIYAGEGVLNEETIRVQTPMNKSPIPIMGISLKHANYLKGILKKVGEIELNLTVDAVYTPDVGVTYNVLGEIPGSMSEEKIVFSAHLDHFFRCIQDNISSCAALLGIAHAVMRSGYRPKRSMIFAFHGAHECGMIDTKYPYISGSYETIKKKMTEWKNKVIADINFEYAALALEELKAVTTIGNEINLFDYINYSPELTGGFEKKSAGTGSQLYNGLSWCDGISYCTAGIPVYTNDIITEQLEGKSAYIGRDHSNHDNWESYNPDALRDSIRYYGGLGIYLDSLPYLEIDFSAQSKRIRVESDFDSLEEQGIKTGRMQYKLKLLEDASKILLKELKDKNQKYFMEVDSGIDTDKQREFYDNARRYNSYILKIFDFFQTKIDAVAPSDFLISRSGKYLMNIGLMEEAEEFLRNKEPEKAKQCLFQVDMAGISYYFSEMISEKMCHQINGKEYEKRRTWASGKELNCYTFYPLMTQLKQKIENGDEDFKEEIKMMRKAIRREMIRFIIELKREFKTIKKGIKMIRCLKESI